MSIQKSSIRRNLLIRSSMYVLLIRLCRIRRSASQRMPLQKLAIRFGETIKKYMASDTLNVDDLTLIPLVFAGWIRYLMGVNDQGESFERSPDPLLETLTPITSKLSLGMEDDVEDIVGDLLHNEAIFGVDLYQAGLADKVVGYLKEMCAGTGAVRAVLIKYTR